MGSFFAYVFNIFSVPLIISFESATRKNSAFEMSINVSMNGLLSQLSTFESNSISNTNPYAINDPPLRNAETLMNIVIIQSSIIVGRMSIAR